MMRVLENAVREVRERLVETAYAIVSNEASSVCRDDPGHIRPEKRTQRINRIRNQLLGKQFDSKKILSSEIEPQDVFQDPFNLGLFQGFHLDSVFLPPNLC